MKSTFLRRAAVLSAVASATISPRMAPANLYWDTNGTGTGGTDSTTGTGIWGTDAFWSADLNGAATTGAWTSGETAVFSAGTNVTGTYTVTLNGTQTAGGITVEEGSLTISGGTALNLNPSSIFDVGSGRNLLVSALVTGGSAATRFTKQGSGVLTLTNTSDSYTGGWIITGGTLVHGGESAGTAGTPSTSGAIPAGVVADYIQLSNNAVLRNTRTGIGITALATNKGITLGTGGGTWDDPNADSSNVHIYSGIITGTGTFTKSGAGVLGLTATQTYNGATNITGGQIRLRTNSNIIPDASAVTISSGAQLDMSNLSDTIGSVAGAGNIWASATAGALTFGGDNSSTSFTGQISTSAATSTSLAITKAGTGTMTISGNDWLNTGVTSINGGGIKFGNTAAGLGNSSTLSLGASGALDMNGINDTIGALTGSGSITNGANLTLSGTNTSAQTFSGNFSGSAVSRVLTKNGTGQQFFSGSNQWTGINFNRGDLRFNGPDASGASGGTGVTIAVAAAVAADTTGVTGVDGIGVSSGVITLNNPITLTTGANLGIFATSGNGVKFDGAISGGGALSRTDFGAGTITLEGNNSFTGGVTLISRGLILGHKNALGVNGGVGGVFSLGSASQAPGATGISLSASTDLSGANAVLNPVTVNRDFTMGGTSALELSGGMNLGTAVRTATVSNSAMTTFSGKLTGTGGGLTKAGAGSLELTNATNDYTGGTSITGGNLAITSDGNLGAPAGTLKLTNGTLAVNGNVSSARTVTMDSGAATFNVGSGFTYTQSGPVVEVGSRTLRKTGFGTMIVSGGTNNNYTSGTSITAGTFELGANSSIPSSSTVTVTSAALNVSTFTDTIGALTLNTGSVYGAGGTLTLSGIVTGTGVSAIGSNLDLGTTGFRAVSLTGATDIMTISGIIVGSGTLTKQNAGTLVLANSNNAFANTAITSGTIRVGATNALPSTGSLTMGSAANSTTVDLYDQTNSWDQALAGIAILGGATAANNKITNTGASLATLTVNNAADNSFAGIIAGNLRLLKSGAGLLALSGANTFTGGTIVSAGSLGFDAGSTGGPSAVTSGPIGTGSLNITGPGVLQAVTSARIVDNAVTAGSDFSVEGSNNLTLGGDMALGGALRTVTVNNSGVTKFGGVVSGTGGLTKAGTGVLVLDNAANFFSGGVSVTGGTLSVGATVHLGDAGNSVTLNGGALRDTTGFSNARSVVLAGAGSIDVVSGTHTITTGISQTGSQTLNKTGAGILLLQANSTATNTVVHDGTLRVDETYTLNSNVTVNAGGTLGGKGTVAGTVDVSGNIAPGASVGVIQTGAETWGPDGTYVWEFNDASDTSNASAGTKFDQIQIDGPLTVSATSGNKFTIDVTSLTGGGAGDAANFDKVANYEWIIATTTSAVTIDPDVIGFIDHVSNDTSATNAPNAVDGAFSILGVGNNVVLKYSAAPEPGSMTLLAMGLVGWLGRRPRRRSAVGVA